MSQQCAASARQIWTSWPEGAVPPETLDHASACACCRRELEALRALRRASSTEKGRPLSWSEILPASRWSRLARSTRMALPEAPASRPWLWAPAVALAAAALLFLARPKPTNGPERAPDPAASAAQLEMLENLDLLENWDLAASLASEKGGAP